MEKNNIKGDKKMTLKIRIIIIAAALVGALLLCILINALIEGLPLRSDEYVTLPPVDKSELFDTYQEDFDIMEYDEYLGLDRNIYHDDKQTGVMQSVSYEKAIAHGEQFVLMYDVIIAIIEGDDEEYNSYMGDERLMKGEFTQQQLYDIKISPYSSAESDGNAEYVYKVTYRIHENNGTYRNTIGCDVSRPQYFYIDNSTGSLKVMKIVE